MEQKLTERDIKFLENWYDPIANLECLAIENIRSPHIWDGDLQKNIKIRPYQPPMLSYAHIFAEDKRKSAKENFTIRKYAGKIINLAARNVGKSLLGIWDVFFHLMHMTWGESCVASFDGKHLRKISKPIKDLAEHHPFFQIFLRPKSSNIRFAHGELEIDTLRGHTLFGKNENIDNIESAGEAFHSLHTNMTFYDEACVDGKTAIRYTKDGKQINYIKIRQFINKGLWKDNLIYSYNNKTKIVELKRVTNIFKKQIKNYENYHIEFEGLGNHKIRKLIVSQKQKIWDGNSYKDIAEFKKGDSFYTSDYFKLTNIQKQIKVEYKLAPVKIKRIERRMNKSWTMYDIEVEDNHNFFANGILISNSYMSKEGTEKRVDAVHSYGCMERLSGIPDVRLGSPLGEIFNDKDNAPFICRIPQFVREDFDNETAKELEKKYNGNTSIAWKLNVEAEIIEGAFGFWDIERIKKECLKSKKQIKHLEVGKDTFSTFENKLVVERLPSEQCFLAADMGEGAAPTEIIVIFYDGKKYKYHYNITLNKLTTFEQEQIFWFLYNKLKECFIAVDCTSVSGRDLIDALVRKGVPQNQTLKVNFNEKIEVDFLKNDDGTVKLDPKSGIPLMRKEYAMEFAMSELEKLFYSGKIDIPNQHKFFYQCSNIICKKSGNRTTYGSSIEADHLHSAFQVWAVCRFFNEFASHNQQDHSKDFICGF